MWKEYKQASYRRGNPQRSQDTVGVEMGAECLGPGWHDRIQWSLEIPELQHSCPGKLWPVPSVGCMRVSSQCRLWRQESEPPRRPTDSPSALMSDPQVGLLNSWVSTCVWMTAEANMLDPCLVRSLGFPRPCLTKVSSVHTYSLHIHENLVLPWHSFSSGMMVKTY